MTVGSHGEMKEEKHRSLEVEKMGAIACNPWTRCSFPFILKDSDEKHNTVHWKPVASVACSWRRANHGETIKKQGMRLRWDVETERMLNEPTMASWLGDLPQ